MDLIVHSHGLVLRSVRYGDQQVIVNIFTEASGMVPFIIRCPRAGKKGFKSSLWQPLTLVEVVWEVRPKASLQKPSELSLWKPWRSLPFEPYKVSMSMFLGEFMYHALRSEQANGPLFDYTVNALEWFDVCEQHYANFHAVFLLHLTRFLGFMPNVEDWHEGSFFDLEAASFVTQPPLHAHFLSPEEAALVPKFLRMDIRSMQAVKLNGAIRRRVLEIITTFYRLHIPEFPELKSLDVLAELFA